MIGSEPQGAPELDAALAALQTGTVSMRLAKNNCDVHAAQALRYKVFYDEMSAQPSHEVARLRRDFDVFDEICDHLLVTDSSLGEGEESVIATYRLLRGRVAKSFGRFYTSSEYDITKLKNLPGETLELGRSCVDARRRNKPTMQILWRGIAAYVFHHNISVMFGCASLPGISPENLSLPLSYLYHNHLAPLELRVKALPELYVDMRFKENHEIDRKKALTSLPPLIKGYLRLGGFIGDGAVVDEQFNTTDVCVIVKTDLVTDKYFKHYSRVAAGENNAPNRVT